MAEFPRMPRRPTPEEIRAHRDDGYRALGRNIAVFSELVALMRDLMAGHLRRPGDDPIIARLVFTNAAAMPITHAFFAMCWHLGEHPTKAEERVASTLSEEVQKVVRRRNDFAHGDWQIAALITDPATRTIALAEPFAWRIDASRKKEPLQKVTRDLDADTDNIERLLGLTHDYGRACFKAHPNGPVEILNVVCVSDHNLGPGPEAAFQG